MLALIVVIFVLIVLRFGPSLVLMVLDACRWRDRDHEQDDGTRHQHQRRTSPLEVISPRGRGRPPHQPPAHEKVKFIDLQIFRYEPMEPTPRAEEGNLATATMSNEEDSTASADSQNVCCVCLSAYQEGDVCATPTSPSCQNHTFHKECLEGWMAQGHFTCPICRTPLDTVDPSPLPSVCGHHRAHSKGHGHPQLLRVSVSRSGSQLGMEGEAQVLQEQSIVDIDIDAADGQIRRLAA
ncbi:unnamed protein product [Vitrella brassicaformis CCMP3155]|uniref:RING-type domain-containing protein n=1 Tax=Vitrella brassicaformis (strain CCMP3155) TaxID=1169540 RepID=A0A0G4FXB4_VITBC|nr:unnamed protein product [Vitrella brassicaformis CCMP3155]|eukprot:CEM20037.1 unnamed protein product [Vitrella brassicaformis CCMP3155]